MHPDLVTASKLQALDQRIVALEKEIATLPKHIALIEKQLEGHLKRLDVDKASLATNLRDRKKLEGDVEMARQKVSKLRALHDKVAARPRIAAYLASERRLPFSQHGIFRNYPELDP